MNAITSGAVFAVTNDHGVWWWISFAVTVFGVIIGLVRFYYGRRTQQKVDQVHQEVKAAKGEAKKAKKEARQAKDETQEAKGGG